MALLESGEMYLETILILSRTRDFVRSVDVGEYMGFSKPSVSVAIRQLREGGFLTMDAGKLLHLTDAGREAAERIYERHCVIMDRLVSIGVDPEIAKRDACQIEHVISRESYEKLKALRDGGTEL